MFLLWCFMLLMVFLIPITMIGVGAQFLKKPPASINALSGYRTSMSMQNMDTWAFAHRCCGRIWLIMGVIMAGLGLVAMLFCLNKDIASIGVYGATVCGVELTLFLFSFLPVEITLRKVFDPYGRRKE